VTRAALIAALALFPASAHAACMPRAVMIERLADRYGEGRESVALDASGQSYERVREAPVTGERS
jgi:hypothetical protein